jgi:hypothetical protein
MPHPSVSVEPAATVETHVWLQEHNWLHALFNSPLNTFPKFRFPDLLAACISVVCLNSESHIKLVEFMVTDLTARDPASRRRSCQVWALQFEQLMALHRGPLNRYPNPRFDLDHMATGCVALASRDPFGEAVVLDEARRNHRARLAAARSSDS